MVVLDITKLMFCVLCIMVLLVIFSTIFFCFNYLQNRIGIILLLQANHCNVMVTT